jgi:hypothetical protein
VQESVFIAGISMSPLFPADHFANMPERVVFIAGANWSGSTVTGAVLGANADPLEYFHLGEVHSRFRPHGRLFGAQQSNANLAKFWGKVDHKVGIENAYVEIQRCSKSKVLIDSSKGIGWLKVQRPVCEGLRIPLLPVVAFRRFAGIIGSALSRNRNAEDALDNVRYYRRLIDSGILGDNWIAVDTEDLVRNPAGLTKALCIASGIPYFVGKESYWNFPMAHLGGGRTQRKHRINPASGGYHLNQIREAELPAAVADQLEGSGLLSLERWLKDKAIRE